MRILFAIGALLLLSAACGDDGGAPTATPTPTADSTQSATPSASPTQAPTPEPTPSPTPPAGLAAFRIAFARNVGTDNRFAPVEQLWIANGDGSGARPVTTEGTPVRFAGMPSPGVMYYIELIGERERALYRLDVEADRQTEVLRFEATWEYEAYAAVSSDERYVAYVERDSLDLFDTQTGQARRLLQGNQPACDVHTIGECHVYRYPVWSPDSRLLAVQEVFYEGGHRVIVDIANPVEIEVAPGEISSGSFVDWSPGSDSVCTGGQYAAPSALYVARPPDWGAQEFFGEFETNMDMSPPSVTGCVWVSDREIALTIATMGAPAAWKLLKIDTATGSTTTFVDSPPSEVWLTVKFRLADSPYVVLEPFSTGYAPDDFGPPTLLDTSTGGVYPILEPGDVIVGAVQLP